MSAKKLLTLLLAALLVLSLAACGRERADDDMTTSPSSEPKNAQEAARYVQGSDGPGECHSDRKTSPFGRRCSCLPTRA